MSDPFDSASRAADLQNAASEIKQKAFESIKEAAASLRPGIASVGFHREAVAAVFEMIGELVDKALELDERAGRHRLEQFNFNGTFENSFSDEREAQLVEFVEREIQGLPKWIRS